MCAGGWMGGWGVLTAMEELTTWCWNRLVSNYVRTYQLTVEEGGLHCSIKLPFHLFGMYTARHRGIIGMRTLFWM